MGSPEVGPKEFGRGVRRSSAAWARLGSVRRSSAVGSPKEFGCMGSPGVGPKEFGCMGSPGVGPKELGRGKFGGRREFGPELGAGEFGL